MSTLEELNKRITEGEQERRVLRVQRNIEFKKQYPSIWYRATHDFDGRSILWQWAVLSIFVAGVVMLMGVGQLGWFSDVGDSNHELEAGRDYTCPYCQWDGNTSEMLGYSGPLGIVYYCPECGEVIGYIPYNERQG